MKFFFAGHTTFGNRGCEALIRSTIGLLRDQIPSSEFVVPSKSIELDRRQWPQAEQLGVRFIPAPPFPESIRWWNRAARVAPPVERLVVPKHRLPQETRKQLEQCDAMIMSGGDVISLDYGLASLYDWTGYVDNAVGMKVPVCLWGASVGPFKAKPYVEKFISSHLSQYAALSSRESATHDYLKSIGVDSCLVADPAFTMKPEPFDYQALIPAGTDGCVGLNFSPLIRGYRDTESSRQALDAEIVSFVRKVLESTELGVLFIPHVDPLDGGTENSDFHYMNGLVTRAGLLGERVKMAPPTLNAAQLKYLISQCRFFIGARTHATIGAFSTGVPTTSIAYSVKAKGINRDLFGHLDHVLETPKVTSDTLSGHLSLLMDRESQIRHFLGQEIPKVRLKSMEAATYSLQKLGVRQGLLKDISSPQG